MAKASVKREEARGKAPTRAREPAPAPGVFGDLFQPFQSLRHEIDRLFDDFGRAWPMAWNGEPSRDLGPVFDLSRGVLTPKVEVSETDKAYEIAVELPGVDEKDIELTVYEDTLTLAGEKKAEEEEKGKGYYRSERSYGAFRRAFHLPEDVNQDKIAAKFDKGVMRVTLPKTGKAKPKGRRIEVK